VRIEQLYPTPLVQILKVKAKYNKATEFFWVQEEPENMGAWPYICRKFHNDKLINLNVVSRHEGSSTATGFAKQHAAQQLHIVTKAFEAPAPKEPKTAKKEPVKLAHVGAD
jgi:2-oxoglutarate dehydrogenase E1 component